jgi:hypothetical protein
MVWYIPNNEVLDMIGSSVKVRNVARRDYVETARKEKGLRISLGDIQRTLQKEGFPPGHLRQIRTSLESRLFWEPVGLRLISSRGQPDRVGTVLEFSFVDLGSGRSPAVEQDPLLELSGILRGAIREGAAAFVRELRRDKDTRVEMRERRGRRSGREESAA